MSLLKAIKAQLGLSNTPANNFTITAEADNGTLKLARGNAGATTQDILTVDADGRVAHGVPMSCIRLNTANGYGSTNTVIRRFTNTVLNQGNDITYADSATLGASFTINKSGVYAISNTDYNSGSASCVGISVNSSQLTTGIAAINSADRLVSSDAPTNTATSCSVITYLSAGSIVRPHNSVPGTGGAQTQFTITRVA